MGHLKTGYDLDFDDISAGALVIDASIKEAFNLCAKEFDFLGTPGKLRAEPHKLWWSKVTRHHFYFCTIIINVG